MTGSVVDTAVFWWQVAAPAAAAVILAAGYIAAAWRWPALRTPIASWRAWRQSECWICAVPGHSQRGPAYWFVRWHLHRTASK